MIETIGYFASAFVGMSFLMTNMKRLRYVNLIGCSLFVVYGVLLNAIPVAAMNLFCCFVNIYYIFKLERQKVAY